MQHTTFLHRLKAWLFLLLPLHLMSAFIYHVTRLQSPYLHWFIRGYIRFFDVDMSIAEKSDPHSYKTFNEFFTRKIKPELRPITQDPTTLANPCDGQILQMGDIEDGTLLQAKGQRYSLKELLGGTDDCAQTFTNGKYITIYLSPRDYHCAHMPVSGQLKTLIYHPGRLVSVAPYTLNIIPSLYARNERVVMLFDTKLGPLALVMVGAVNVGSVSVQKIGLIMPQRHAIQRTDYGATPKQQAISFERGEEVANFNMGSTAILLTANPDLAWAEDCRTDKQVQMGQAIAQLEH